MRAILVSKRFCLVDRPGDDPTIEDFSYTREADLTGGLGSVLTRIARRVTGRECVVLIDLSGADAIGLPSVLPGGAGIPTVPDTGRDVDHLVSTAAAGWTGPASLRPWMVFSAKDRPTLYVGVINWQDGMSGALNGDRMPFAPDAFAHHLQWLQMMGTTWHHTPGIAALAALRGQDWPHARNPTWKPEKALAVPAWELSETSWNYQQWTNPDPVDIQGQPVDPEAAPRVIYDRVRAGLSAIISAEVAAFSLRHYQGSAFDRSRAGFWLIESGTWNHPTMPDPRGYGTGCEHAERWMTTPTVALLQDLTEAGLFGGFRVRDSWTGDGSRLFRKWGERMRDAYSTVDTLPVETDRDVMRTAVKDGYRQVAGMLTLASSTIYRPDWAATLRAVQRIETWRNAWEVWSASGLAPFSMHGDAVTYLDPTHAGADLMTPYTRKNGQPRFAIADRLGAYHCKIALPATVSA